MDPGDSLSLEDSPSKLRKVYHHISSNPILNPATSTEMMLKAVRFMKPSKHLSSNKFLENILNFKENIMHNIMNTKRGECEAWSLFEFLKNDKFFKQFVNRELLEHDEIVNICKVLRYEKVLKGNPVFIQGEPSNGKVYILFSGEILVCLNKLDVYEEENIQREERLLADNESESFAQDLIDSPKLSKRNLSIPGLSERRDSINSFRIEVQSPSSRETKRRNSNLGISFINDNDSNKQVKRSIFSQAKQTPTPSDTPKQSVKQFHKLSSKNETSLDTLLDQKTENEIRSSPIKPDFEQPKSSFQRQIRKRTSTLFKIDPITPIKDPLNDSMSNINFYKQMRPPYGYIKDTISERGAYFGDLGLEELEKRPYTLLAETDCELLVLPREEFTFIKKHYDTERRELVTFLLNTIPMMDKITNRDIFKSFIYMFEIKILEIGNHIITEGINGEIVYILYQGTAEAYKTIHIQEPEYPTQDLKKIKSFFVSGHKEKENIILYNIEPGTFIGEELMFDEANNNIYNYSVRITSNKAKVLTIDRNKLRFKLPIEGQQQLLQLSQEKKIQKEKKLLEQLARRKLEMLSENCMTYPIWTRKIQEINPPDLARKLNSRHFGSQSVNSSPKLDPLNKPSPKESPRGGHLNRPRLSSFNIDTLKSETHVQYEDKRNEIQVFEKQKSQNQKKLRIEFNQTTPSSPEKYDEQIVVHEMSSSHLQDRGIHTHTGKGVKDFVADYKANMFGLSLQSKKNVNDVDYFRFDFGASVEHLISPKLALKKRLLKIEKQKQQKEENVNQKTLYSSNGLLSLEERAIKRMNKDLYFYERVSRESPIISSTVINTQDEQKQKFYSTTSLISKDPKNFIIKKEIKNPNSVLLALVSKSNPQATKKGEKKHLKSVSMEICFNSGLKQKIKDTILVYQSNIRRLIR